MAEGLSSATATSILDAIANAVAYSIATPYVQLHIAAPGPAGTANVATETTRKLVSFGVSAAGSVANDAAVTWTGIAGSQDATHFTIWTAAAAGTFVCSGVITANAFTAGDTYNAAIGAFTLSFPVAS